MISIYTIFGTFNKDEEKPRDCLPDKQEDGYIKFVEVSDPFDFSGCGNIVHFLRAVEYRNGARLVPPVIDLGARNERLFPVYQQYVDDSCCYPSLYEWDEQEVFFLLEDHAFTTLTVDELLNFNYDRVARIIDETGNHVDEPKGATYRSFMPDQWFPMLEKAKADGVDFIIFAFD